MRTRDKKSVPVKVKCSGCSVRTLVGDATIEVGTRIERVCKHCGATIRKVIGPSDIEAAIDRYLEDRDFGRRLASGDVREGDAISFYPSPDRSRELPDRTPTEKRRKVRSDQVVGAAKLYHYAIYVRHPWGTDRIVIGVQKREIQLARDAAWDRVGRARKTGDLKILDAVPMKWTSEGMVETRRTRITTGTLKKVRKAKARASVRQTNRNGASRPIGKTAPKIRKGAKVEHVEVKTKKGN